MVWSGFGSRSWRASYWLHRLPGGPAKIFSGWSCSSSTSLFLATSSPHTDTVDKMEAKENVRKMSRNEACVWLPSFPQIIRSRGIALWSSPAFLQGPASIYSHTSIASVPPGCIKSFLNIENICIWSLHILLCACLQSWCYHLQN